MTPQTEQMVEVAQQYCELIEHAADCCPPSERWLGSVASLLPRINAAVTALDADLASECTLSPDLESRFELFSRLYSLLGELDSYWLEFDMLDDDVCKSGSLADDLTDIYCELKSGLDLVRSGNHDVAELKAVASWRESYRAHWGRHLMDAQRHLIDLDVAY